MAKIKSAAKTSQPVPDAAAAHEQAAQGFAAVAEEATRPDHELYGEVKPTMVNGVYIGDGTERKPAPTLAERIAAVFTNEAQIAVVLDVLAVAQGRTGEIAQSTSVGALSLDIEERLKLLEQNAETVDDHLQEIGNSDVSGQLESLERRLAALEKANPLPAPSAS